MSKPRGLLYFPKHLKASFGPYMACCERVIDGDTVVVCCDFGARSYPTIAVRLYGINAPESHEPGGPEATNYLAELMPRDAPCLIRSHAWSFERIVGSILLADGRDVASEMVAAGHAQWADY